MSQRNRMYERIKGLFSKTRLVAPDSPLQAAAKLPAPRTPAEVRIERTEETQARPSAEEKLPAAAMGYAYDQEKVISLEESPLPPLENALCVPLMVSGTTIGTIQAAGNEADWTPQEIEIISGVAAQLARHLDHLRNLENVQDST